MKKTTVHRLVLCSLIAAVYATASLALAPFSFMNIQCRISEALVLLPIIMPESIIGVALGCAITNAIGAAMGANLLGYLDVIIGTLATLIAAYFTYRFRKIRIKNIPVLSALMPVLFNGIFIGAELAFALGNGGFDLKLFAIFGAEVAFGEFIACFVLGIPLIMALSKNKTFNTISK